MPSIDAAAALHASRHAPGGPDEVPGLPLIGTGSPEGVVSASVGAVWIDSNATFGAVEWTKFTGTGTTGWRVTKGDTGDVDVTTQITIGGAAPIIGDSVKVRRTPHHVTFTMEIAARATPATPLVVTLPHWARPTQIRASGGSTGGNPNLLVYASGGTSAINVYSIPANTLVRVSGFTAAVAETVHPWRTA